MRHRASIVAAILALTSPALGEPAPADQPTAEHVSGPRRALAIAVAAGPGFFLRGSGSYVLGTRTRTAKRLAKFGAIGLGTMIAAGLPLGITGAPDFVSIPAVPLILAGASFYVPTWFADLWVVTGLDKHHGFARALPPYAIELGTSWVHDPFRERGLARAAGRIALGRLDLGAQTMIDAEGEDKLLEGSASWRLHGKPATGELTPDTTRYGVRVNVRGHRDDVDDVTTLTGDLVVWGRYDLVRLDDRLDGTFIDSAIGLGLERASYGRDAGFDEHDWNGLTIGRIAWGAYLFDRGEAQIFYSHRRDDMVGGPAAWRLAGFIGSIGGEAIVPLGRSPWMLRGSLELGNAVVSTLAIRYHGGLR